MSESIKHHQNVEHMKSGESQAEHIEVKVHKKEHLPSKEKHEALVHQEQQEHESRHKVEQEAKTGKEQILKTDIITEVDANKPIQPNQSYNSVMHRVEQQLPSYQRVFSKIIRNPSVDKASVIVGKTVARPSAIIGASALAFIGLAIFGYIAKQVGFELPSSLFVFLVLIGWLAGILFEFIFRGTRRIVSSRRS